MRILGIDPGYGIVGYSVVDYIGNKFKLIVAGAIKTKPNSEFTGRLVQIYDELTEILDLYKPEEASIEKLYFNQNTTTALQVAEARGVITLAIKKKGVEVFEYTPIQIKQSVTGYGRATKTQVQKMVSSILKTNDFSKLDDTTDSIAMAICHAHTGGGNSLLRRALKNNK